MMRAVLDTIQRLDIGLYYFLNGFAGLPILDNLANFEEQASLLKGALFLGVYWYFWTAPRPGREKRRIAIVSVLSGALLSIVTCRLIADLGPYRVRPLYDLHIQHRPYAIPISPKLVNWSAFPSDTASFFFALAFGVRRLSSRLGVAALLYVAVWICLPRMFFGLHYGSDVVVGGFIGITMVWVALNTRLIEFGVAPRVLAFADARPQVFCVAAFLVSFELSVLFDDVRLGARTAFNIVRLAPLHSLVRLTWLTSLLTVGSLAIALYFLTRIRAVWSARAHPARVTSRRADVH
jgi:undecaprenyl-diphosphatase